eukprot:UN09344
MSEYFAKFKIVRKVAHPRGGSCYNFWAGMGIAIYSHKESSEYFPRGQQWYKYYAKGMKASSRDDYHTGFAVRYTTDDIVCLYLDGSDSFWNLSFSVENKMKKKVFYTKIPKHFDYYIVAELYMKGDEIELIQNRI